VWEWEFREEELEILEIEEEGEEGGGREVKEEEEGDNKAQAKAIFSLCSHKRSTFFASERLGCNTQLVSG
jgi:hypothetical protein